MSSDARIETTALDSLLCDIRLCRLKISDQDEFELHCREPNRMTPDSLKHIIEYMRSAEASPSTDLDTRFDTLQTILSRTPESVRQSVGLRW